MAATRAPPSDSTASPPSAATRSGRKRASSPVITGIGIELLIGVFSTFFGFFLQYIEEGQALDLQLVGEDEGNPVVPGQRQPRRQLAGGEVTAHFLAVEGGGGRSERLQLFLVDRF